MSNVKVVGMGPFPLPGEKKRHAKAEKKARELLKIVENLDKEKK